jgi:hypothetical protein
MTASIAMNLQFKKEKEELNLLPLSRDVEPNQQYLESSFHFPLDTTRNINTQHNFSTDDLATGVVGPGTRVMIRYLASRCHTRLQLRKEEIAMKYVRG